MSSVAVVVDHAALQVAEEDILGLELTELGSNLIIVNIGALVVVQGAQVIVEMCTHIGRQHKGGVVERQGIKWVCAQRHRSAAA